MKNKSVLKKVLGVVLLLAFLVGVYYIQNLPDVEPEDPSPQEDPIQDPEGNKEQTLRERMTSSTYTFSLEDVPEYSGKNYTILNDNIPLFREEDITTKSYEYYGDLDKLGRCTVAYACLGKDLMPNKKRGDISMIKPTGWKQKFYDFIDSEALYNRSHLIAFSLAGEEANEKNLITGTRYMNSEGMVPFETMVCDYIKETNCHVLYRVTPIFKGSNLLASGVTMEAYSVEDEGESICYYVYLYNVQPGVTIDYKTGKNYETTD